MATDEERGIILLQDVLPEPSTSTVIILSIVKIIQQIQTVLSNIGSSPYVVENENKEQDNKTTEPTPPTTTNNNDVENPQVPNVVAQGTANTTNKRSTTTTTVKGESTDGLVDHGNGIAAWITFNTIAVATIVSGIVSMVLVNNIIVDISSVLLAVCIGPILLYQRQQIKIIGTFRSQHNHLRNSINIVHDENVKLQSSLTNMEGEISKLDTVTKQLETIATTSGRTVNDIETIIKKNNTLQNQMISILQQQVLQQIITASYHSDSDQDFLIDTNEIDLLLLRLQGIKGVTVDSTKIKLYLQSTAQAGAITYSDFIAIARDIHSATINPFTSPTTPVSTSQQFFTFEPQAYLETTTTTTSTN